MSQTGLDAFDRTLQKSNALLDELCEELHTDDRNAAYLALRATLHALRDRLIPDEAVHLGAQLPMLISGAYYDGWRPSQTPKKYDREGFLDAVRSEFPATDSLNPQRAAAAVFHVLSRHVSEGQIRHVRDDLPEDLRELWGDEAAVS